MGKGVIIIIWILVCSILTGLFIMIPEDTTVSAITITVDDDGPANYSKIQDAINASNDGDTVYVYNGTYYENVVVNKTINIIGEDKNNTIINGSGIGTTVTITSNWVNITEFAVTYSGTTGMPNYNAGISLHGVHNCSVFNNNVRNNLNTGILLNFSNSNNITNNVVSANPYGIHLVSSNGNNISSNNVSQNWAGIYIRRSNNNNVTFNNASDNNKGIYHLDSIGTTINKNILNFNIEYGMRLYNSSGNIVAKNNASSNWAGISLDSSNGNNVTDNNAFSNTRDGIWLQFSMNNSIIDNKVFNNENGINIFGPGWNNITNNIATNNDIGIFSDMTWNNSITNNNASNNNDYGIQLRISYNSIITGNNFSSNSGTGIDIILSQRNNITGNNASFNGLGGVQLRRSDNNTITSNILSSNSGPGIRIYDDSKYNYIITNIVLTNDYGIRVFNLSDGNNIIGNTLLFNSGNGIDVWSSSNNTISENNASNNDGGIKLTLSAENMIINNTFFSSTWHGILLDGSDRNKIKSNNASLNSATGIYLGGSDWNDVFDNTLSNNERGIYLFSASNNTIYNCTVFSSNYGIRPEQKSHDNHVINSTILYSGSYDFHLSGDSNLIAINSTFNKSKVYFNDQISNLTIKWYMHVRVESTNAIPISNAGVEVKNIADDPIEGSPFVTGSDGFLRWIVVTEYIQNDTNGGSPGGDNKIYSTPHNITVTLNGSTAYADPEPQMDVSKIITIILDIIEPIADAGNDASVEEDEPYTFDGSGSFDNVGVVNWTWDFDDGFFGYGEKPTHSFTSSGSYVAILNVNDAAGNRDTDTVNIFVNNVPPTADAGIDKSGDEGVQIYFNGDNSIDTASDNDSLIYSWNFGDGKAGSGKIINHTYDDNGTYTVTLLVTDDDGATSSDSITVTINNTSPTIMPIPPQFLLEDEPYTVQIIATDVKGDKLTFSDNSSMFDINPMTGVIIFTPTNADVGVHRVNITVADDDGTESYLELQINIQNTNDAPIITSSPITMALENLTYYYNVSAEDDDSDTLNYTLELEPEGMIMDSEGRISWTPTYEQASFTFMVMVNVSDGIDFDIQSYSITVVNVNDEPSIISIPISSATEDIHYTYDFEAINVDIGDWLSYSLDAAPEGMNIDSSSGLINWIPTNDQVGENPVIVNVTDSFGAYNIQEFTIIVTNINDAPVLEEIGPLVATEGEVFSYTVTAFDIDYGDTITYSDDSQLLDINSSTGIISFTPTNNDVGVHLVKITVTDSEGAVDFQRVLFTVNNVNNPPSLTNIDPQTLEEDVPFTLFVTATDMDLGDVLVFSDNTTLFDIDSNSGIISFTPTNENVGIYLVNVTVKDKSGSFAYQIVTFTVNNENDPPIIEPIEGLTATAGKEFTYTVTATELDQGDILIFSDDSEIFDINQNTGEISFTPKNKDAGVHYVTITVTDTEGESDQITLMFNILGEKEEEPFDFTWILLLVIVGLIAFFLGYMMNRKGKTVLPEEKEEGEEGVHDSGDLEEKEQSILDENAELKAEWEDLDEEEPLKKDEIAEPKAVWEDLEEEHTLDDKDSEESEEWS